MTWVPCICEAGGYDLPVGECPTLDEIADGVVDHLAACHEPLRLPPLGVDLVGPTFVPSPPSLALTERCPECFRLSPCPNHVRARAAA